MSSMPLQNLKVLDLGTFIAAPFCATILAEFGAEKIKIEDRISGYDQDGTSKDLPGFGRIAQAFGGLTYLCGFPDRPPANPRLAAIADYLSGLFVAFGVLAAGHERAATGKGQVIDVALYESIFRILDGLAVPHLLPHRRGSGKVRDRYCARGPSQPLSNNGRALDRHCLHQRPVIQASGGAHMPAWADVGLPLHERTRARSEPRSHRCDRRAMDKDDEFGTAERGAPGAEIPSSPIDSIADNFADPPYESRRDLVSVMHPRLGEIRMPAMVPGLSATFGKIAWLGRDLCEDTDKLLSQALGYGRERIDALRRQSLA